jgi:uncharacterized tellurite resistance protein B-like protein
LKNPQKPLSRIQEQDAVMNLLDRLTALFQGTEGSKSGKHSYSPEDPRVAAAALMFHLVDADGVREDSETKRVRELLHEAFGVDGRELVELVEAGQIADQQSIDLYAFTSVLKRSFDFHERCEFIEIMWEIAYADGERHELEDNIVWRIAELIGVDSKDRIGLRQRVEARLAGGSDGETSGEGSE